MLVYIVKEYVMPASLLSTTLEHPYLVMFSPLSFIFMCRYVNCDSPYLKVSQFCSSNLQ